MNRLFCLLSVCGLLATLPARSQAQPERYEVGQRLRAFEAAWDEHTATGDRRRCLAPLGTAANAFVAHETMRIGSLAKVGEELDKARRALCSADAPKPDALWAESLWLLPERRLLNTAAGKLPFKLRTFYAVEGKQPKEAGLRLTLLDGKGREARPAADFTLSDDFTLSERPFADQLPLKDVAEGDYRLRVEVLVGGKVLARSEQRLSLVNEAEGRLKALKEALDALPSEPARTDTATARAQHRLLKSLSEGTAGETDCPAARLLAEAEAMVRAAAGGKTYHGNGGAGQFWLALPTGERTTEVRLLAPQAVKDGKPLPLVIALHGLGGSGHLFFEGYGRGAMVRECKKRGWLLVAPHLRGSLPVAKLIEEVDRLYPVDQKRVYLVGHSMGARQAVDLAGQAPRRFAAVAALAGGGPFKVSEELKDVPFFVAVGEKDSVPFAPGWARDLVPALDKAGVRELTFKKYADIEHLLVVQAALADVFAFFARKH
jgi:poly(3-hydroxybutyrate) depolymerase